MSTPAHYDANVKEQTSRELVRNGVKYSMADQVARVCLLSLKAKCPQRMLRL